MSIHFTLFNVFLRKITRFRYKDFAEEVKKETALGESSLKSIDISISEIRFTIIFKCFLIKLAAIRITPKKMIRIREKYIVKLNSAFFKGSFLLILRFPWEQQYLYRHKQKVKEYCFRLHKLPVKQRQ